jgi:hypothetical protein
MSIQTLPAAKPRRRYGWWIAGGIGIGVVALGVAGFVAFSQPIKFMAGFLQGNPTLPGCETTTVSEGKVGPLWNRIVDLKCSNTTMHIVFVRRTPTTLPFVLPAVMSVDGPAPVAIREVGNNAYEVEFASPLADGRTSVPLTLDKNGVVKEFQAFEHGRSTKKKTVFG